MPRTLTQEQYQDISGNGLNNFLNSLFDDWPGPFAPNVNLQTLFRGSLTQQIKDAEINGEIIPMGRWLICENTKNLMLGILRGYWMFRDTPNSRRIESDKRFIQLLRDYIGQHNLQMIVPTFRCANKQVNAPSCYRLIKPKTFTFKENNLWVRESIDAFLELFLLGAHIVIIQSANDIGTALPDFFARFKQLPGAGNAGHSHYTDHKISLNGQNYPNLTLNTTEGNDLDKLTNPAHAVLLPVVLCDHTANKSPNAFFQMEGWRPGKSMFGASKYEYRNPALAGGYRHGADFDTHQKTCWNISTYGASPYSEKRGGTIFLAPKRWGLLKLYRGFGGHAEGHKWYKQELLQFD